MGVAYHPSRDATSPPDCKWDNLLTGCMDTSLQISNTAVSLSRSNQAPECNRSREELDSEVLNSIQREVKRVMLSDPPEYELMKLCNLLPHLRTLYKLSNEQETLA